MVQHNVKENMNAEHFQKLKNMYLRANINTQIFDTTECEIESGKAQISLIVSEKYFHALGAMHGAVYFKLLDDAAYFAVSSMVTDYFVLTTSFHIQLVRPVSAGKLTAVGKVRFKAKAFFVAEATLYNEAGKEIAFGTGNFVKSNTPLTEALGYR